MGQWATQDTTVEASVVPVGRATPEPIKER
jgi:hypothetical protein